MVIILLWKDEDIVMLSYVFKNKKNRQNDIVKVCVETLNMKIVRYNNIGMYLSNDVLDVLIKKKYTYVLLSDEKVNICELERIF